MEINIQINEQGNEMELKILNSSKTRTLSYILFFIAAICVLYGLISNQLALILFAIFIIGGIATFFLLGSKDMDIKLDRNSRLLTRTTSGIFGKTTEQFNFSDIEKLVLKKYMMNEKIKENKKSYDLSYYNYGLIFKQKNEKNDILIPFGTVYMKGKGQEEDIDTDKNETDENKMSSAEKIAKFIGVELEVIEEKVE
ncbi:MAG: hypothetical protein ACK4J0_03735 [Candidatus Anstonellaceae archaeon]